MGDDMSVIDEERTGPHADPLLARLERARADFVAISGELRETIARCRSECIRTAATLSGARDGPRVASGPLESPQR
jgi:hypothetical protein